MPRLQGNDIGRVMIELQVGELRFHDPEQVRFWISEMLRQQIGSDLSVKTSIRVIKPELRCKCGFSGPADIAEADHELAHHGVYDPECPKCGSADCEIEHGNECQIKSVRFS